MVNPRDLAVLPNQLNLYAAHRHMLFIVPCTAPIDLADASYAFCIAVYIREKSLSPLFPCKSYDRMVTLP